MQPVQAYKTLDCASKVRIHYHLPRPVTTDLLELFQDATVAIQRFSQYSPAAKDHFTIAAGTRLYAAGVLGETRVVATFGKSHEAWPEEIDGFERRLRAAGYGPFEHSDGPELSLP